MERINLSILYHHFRLNSFRYVCVYVCVCMCEAFKRMNQRRRRRRRCNITCMSSEKKNDYISEKFSEVVVFYLASLCCCCRFFLNNSIEWYALSKIRRRSSEIVSFFSIFSHSFVSIFLSLSLNLFSLGLCGYFLIFPDRI